MPYLLASQCPLRAGTDRPASCRMPGTPVCWNSGAFAALFWMPSPAYPGLSWTSANFPCMLLVPSGPKLTALTLPHAPGPGPPPLRGTSLARALNSGPLIWVFPLRLLPWHLYAKTLQSLVLSLAPQHAHPPSPGILSATAPGQCLRNAFFYSRTGSRRPASVNPPQRRASLHPCAISASTSSAPAISVPWAHDAVLSFSSSTAANRGAVNFSSLACAPPGSPLALIGDAMRWWWWARRPAPCPGPPHLVVAGQDLLLDHFRWPDPHVCLVVRVWSPPCTSFVAPTSASERLSLMSKFRHSRPGCSGWKLCYLEAFPLWVQDLFWFAVDLQRATGCVSSSLHRRATPPPQALRWLAPSFHVGGGL